jgi:hypothetical protein
MDVKELLSSKEYVVDKDVELTGWLVDQKQGLFLLGDHWPENYEYEFKIRISNFNIIYPILKTVPSLGGGSSLLFYKAKIFGTINRIGEIDVETIYVQLDRNKNEFKPIDIQEEVVAAAVLQNGDYKFDRVKGPMQDWLSDIE